MIKVLVILLLSFFGQNGALFSDEDNALLPNLFHLDDHDRCLLQPNSLYCLGEFDLSPVGQSPMYQNIKKYAANNRNAFNRSRLHRGYCVSARCPSTHKNASLRFERCVDMRARRHSLSARLRTLQYCTTRQQYAARAQQPHDAAQNLFLQIVYALLALNIIGTVYDVAIKDEKRKNGLITSWSIRASWRRLTITDEADPRLNPIQGIRVVTMLVAIYAHICTQHFQFHVTNPNFLETLAYRIDGVILSSGTSLIQIFIIISSFLTAYNLLLYSEKRQLTLSMLPVILIKRVIRIAPLHMLFVGFNATFLPAMHFGALSAVIKEYGATCRRKLWAHFLFLNNVLDDGDNSCLMPTWFLPVDMHLFVVSSALTIIMCRRRRQARRLYVFLFVVSAAACGIVAYVKGYRTLIHETVPEKLRGLFKNSKSFGGFYTSTWGSLPACFVGLIMADLYYELQQAKYDWNQNQWFKRLHSCTILLGSLLTIIMGITTRDYKQPWVTALFLSLDRVFMSSILFFLVIGSINIDGGQRRFFGWQGWRVPARLSLPVMLSHWIVSVVITARPVAYHSSVFDVSIDYLTTLFYSYAISVPVALMVEIPVRRFFAQIF